MTQEELIENLDGSEDLADIVKLDEAGNPIVDENGAVQFIQDKEADEETLPM